MQQKDGANKARKPREASDIKEAKEKRSGTDCSQDKVQEDQLGARTNPGGENEERKEGKWRVESSELDQGLLNPPLQRPE